MVHLVWLLGALIVAWGLAAVIKPEWMKAFLQFMSRGRSYLLAGFLRLFYAVVFLILGKETGHPKTTLFFGLLFLTGGILVFVLPQAKIKAMINWWLAKPLWVLRVWGVAAVVFGAFVIYAGWPAAA